jgi:hypothetical protein
VIHATRSACSASISLHLRKTFLADPRARKTNEWRPSVNTLATNCWQKALTQAFTPMQADARRTRR